MSDDLTAIDSEELKERLNDPGLVDLAEREALDAEHDRREILNNVLLRSGANSVCDICGALVVDTAKHQGYHDKENNV
jgi:hypothetical protein